MILKYFLLAILHASLVECQYFPQSCKFFESVLDCRDVYIANIGPVGGAVGIYAKTERLLLGRVIEFKLARSNFPNLRYIEIGSTRIPCREIVKLFPAATIQLNGQTCKEVSNSLIFNYYFFKTI